jgi:transposase-like protein
MVNSQVACEISYRDLAAMIVRREIILSHTTIMRRNSQFFDFEVGAITG